MPKKVLMLLSNPFLPDPRVEKEAKALDQAGYDVTVLAWDRKGEEEPTFNGEGFKVVRVPTRSSRGHFFLGLPLFSIKVVIKGLRADYQVLHAHDFDTLPQGAFLAKMKGAKLIYDSHEHYAKMIMLDMPSSIAKMVDWWESRLVSRADLVVAANDPIMDHLDPSVKGEKVVVMNCIDLPPSPPARSLKRDKIVLFYGGALEPGRYVLELIEAVKNDERCVLRIAGRGRYETQVKDAIGHCPRISFLGYVDQKTILRETAAADAVTSLLDPSNENYRIATPVKLLEAMAVGVPVMTTSGTLTAKIVEEEDCGIVLDWSQGAFSSAVTKLKDKASWDRMSSNARKAAEEKYNWKVMRERLLRAYEVLGE
jgi:glycosyltransferase involved in cell wall biosynthesis